MLYMDTKRSRALRTLGLNVRQRREKAGLTQEKTAELAKLDPTYISGIERGVRNPSILSVCRVAAALDVTVSELCEGVEV